MMDESITQKINAAMLQVDGPVTARQLAAITGLTVRSISSWMPRNAAANNIHIGGISPRLYHLSDPEARTRLQNVLGSHLSSNQLPRRHISERHTASASRSYSLPRSQSAAFLSMEAA